MRKQTKYNNGEIELSWLKDKRHTTKPFTKNMWANYEELKQKYNTETLAKKYKVSKRTIYKWNSELKDLRKLWLEIFEREIERENQRFLEELDEEDPAEWFYTQPEEE